LRVVSLVFFVFFFSSRRRHTRFSRDWSSDVCSSDLVGLDAGVVDAAVRALVEVHRIGVAEQVVHVAENLLIGADQEDAQQVFLRSEERRVGKECKTRWSEYHEKRKEEWTHSAIHESE